MSNALAIAGVSALLRQLLLDGIDAHGLQAPLGGSVTVKTVPPSNDSNFPDRLNLYLYQTSENPAMRNMDLPARTSMGDRRRNARLTLDLHYLLTAYGSDDYHSELLLGSGMHSLHENPILSRDVIGSLLSTVAVGSLALNTAGLAEQLELIKITPRTMDSEELSRIWSMFQTPYHSSAAYCVTVALIESDRPAIVAPPVLDPRFAAAPSLDSPYPTITSIELPTAETGLLLGETVSIRGLHLSGTEPTIHLQPLLNGASHPPITPDATADDEIRFTLPNLPSTSNAGLHELFVEVIRPEETTSRTSNKLPLAVQPEILSLTPNRLSSERVDLSLTIQPELAINQIAELIIGSESIQLAAASSRTNTLEIPGFRLPPGNYLSRLRIDGVDCRFIDRSTSPPQFLSDRIISIP